MKLLWRSFTYRLRSDCDRFSFTFEDPKNNWFSSTHQSVLNASGADISTSKSCWFCFWVRQLSLNLRIYPVPWSTTIIFFAPSTCYRIGWAANQGKVSSFSWCTTSLPTIQTTIKTIHCPWKGQSFFNLRTFGRERLFSGSLTTPVEQVGTKASSTLATITSNFVINPGKEKEHSIAAAVGDVTNV